MTKILVSVAAVALTSPAFAVVYTVNVYEGSVGTSFPATVGSVNTVSGTSDSSTANFTYSGPLAFSTTSGNDLTSTFFGANVANISGYTGSSKTAAPVYGNGGNFSTLAGYLGSSGSVTGYGFGSLYLFTAAVGDYSGLGLTITHDDGASVYANGVLVPGETSAPTAAVTETVFLPTGTTRYTIAYARENGAPSVLNVAAVPEPATWALMLAGFGAIGYSLRRRRTPLGSSFA